MSKRAGEAGDSPGGGGARKRGGDASAQEGSFSAVTLPEGPAGGPLPPFFSPSTDRGDAASSSMVRPYCLLHQPRPPWSATFIHTIACRASTDP